MSKIGIHASHELFNPCELLRLMRLAEAAGFSTGMCSDHFHPWTLAQGQSGFSFAWLGAALATTSLELGTICCPYGRYHPAVVAQAAATLATMFPGRFWLAVGTGQALNEHIAGTWPSQKSTRRALLREAVEIIRALWAGDEVTHEGVLKIDRAKLFTRPQRPPLLFGAAISADTAEWVGSWADGLLTVAADQETLANVLAAFRRGGGEGKLAYLQAMVSYDADEALAWNSLRDRWPVAILSQDELQNVATTAEFSALSQQASVADLKALKLRASSNLQQHAAWLAGDLELGFDRVFLHSVSPSQDRFLEAFSARVLPQIAALNKPG